MAQLAIGVAGGLLTSALNVPGGFGTGFAVAAAVAGLFLHKSDVRSPSITDHPVSGSAAGRPIAEGDGTMIFTSPVIYYGTQRVERRTVSTKNFGPKTEEVSTFRTFAVGIAAPPTTAGWDALINVFADKTLIVDNSPGGNTDPDIQYTWYSGSSTQKEDPTLQGLFTDIPAHRGLSYLVFIDFPETKFGGRIPSVIECTVTENATQSFPSTQFDFPDEFNSNQAQTFILDPYRPIVYMTAILAAGSGDRGLLRFDQVTGNLTSWRENPWENFLDALGGDPLNDNGFGNGTVDRYGSIWIDAKGAGVSSIFRYLYRVDPNTLLASSPLVQPTEQLPIEVKYITINQDLTTPNYAAVTSYNEASIWLYYCGGNAQGVNSSALGRLEDIDSHAEDISGICWDTLGHLWTVGGTTLREWSISGLDSDNLSGSLLNTFSVASFGGNRGNMAYWPEGNTLVIATASAGGDKILYWDIDAAAGTLSTTSFDGYTASAVASAWNTWIVNDTMALTKANGDMLIINVNSDTEEILTESDYGLTIANNNTLWDAIANCAYYSAASGADGRMCGVEVTGGCVGLDTVVTRRLTRVGYDAADFNVSALSGKSVCGLRMERRMSGRALLEKLKEAYFFDLVEIDWKLVATLRGGASTLTIPEEDLGAVAGSGESDNLVMPVRPSELEMPLAFDVAFINKDREYQADVRRDIRETAVVSSTAIEGIDSPIAFSASEAFTIAAKWLLIKRTEFTITFELTMEYVRLDPSDVTTVTTPFKTYDVRFLEVEIGADSVIRVRAAFQLGFNYTGVSKTWPSGDLGFTSPSIKLVGATKFLPLDAPLLSEENDKPGFYAEAGAAASGTTWTAASVRRSDDGVTYEPWQSFDTEATHGVALNALGNHKDWSTHDRVNTLSVLIANGKTLTSVTVDQALAGSNACALVNSTGVEVIFFETATSVGDGVWDLTGLVRGRLGTEANILGHLEGETWALLETSTLISANEALAKLNTERFYIATTFNQQFESVERTEFTNTGRRITPLAPTYLRGSRDGSNNLTIDWNRRSRFRQRSLFFDPPLDEPTERYELKLYGDKSLSSVELLMYMDSAFIDSSSNNRVITAVGSAFLDGGNSIHGPSSAHFDGNGDYLTAPGGTHFDLGSGDFTIECWAYVEDGETNNGLVSRSSSGNSRYELHLDTSGVITFYAPAINSPTFVVRSTTKVQAIGWFHIAVTREGNVFSLFINGAREDMLVNSASISSSGNALHIGTDVQIPAARSFKGFIDDFRFTKGVSRYNSNFTPDGLHRTDLLRTVTVDNNQYEYSAANQTADGITSGDSIGVAVVQVSTRVGNGYETSKLL